ncbi:putative manganese transporter [Haloarcula marina]|uniref:putative manganese transporter n=1 Tax=Haloarcula marina TaxID=2961574 RepID=UPI003D6830B0
MQPLAGALLGLTPGCGGAIMAMPLYIRGTVSFRTVVAALATALACRLQSGVRCWVSPRGVGHKSSSPGYPHRAAFPSRR